MIPPITDPLGQYWVQPNPQHILIDATHAVMTWNTFRRLAEYSTSLPSGQYPGKMWKSNPGKHWREAPDQWLLCWYGEVSPDGKFIETPRRKILCVDSEMPSRSNNWVVAAKNDGGNG